MQSQVKYPIFNAINYSVMRVNPGMRSIIFVLQSMSIWDDIHE